MKDTTTRSRIAKNAGAAMPEVGQAVPPASPACGRFAALTPRHLVRYALAAVIFLGCWLRFLHLGDVNQRSPDEVTYTGFAAQIADKGIGTFPSLFADFVQQ